MRKIKSISYDGIHYIDDTGQTQFIDFKQCNSNWKENNKGKTGVTEEYLAETVCIGERGGLYFVFYTEPKTVINFKRSIWCLKPRKAFYKLQMDIVYSGWSTYDLS